MSLGKNLKRARKERGMTQMQLALEIGTSLSLVSKYESGKTVPRITAAARIAEALDISLDELIGTESSENPSGGEAPGGYRKRIITAAINHRINQEIKRLSEGMNISPVLVRKIWKGSLQK